MVRLTEGPRYWRRVLDVLAEEPRKEAVGGAKAWTAFSGPPFTRAPHIHFHLEVHGCPHAALSKEDWIDASLNMRGGM